RIEKGVSFLSGKFAQQLYFINETVMSDKLKWLYNFVSDRAWHSSRPVYCLASRIKNSIWNRN
ncbi:hypothetical protein OZK63_41765, partial [Streptomyces sp. UMAF16]|nr:hypothetical protein [Streptomyces sp. UMAF16]